MKESGFVFTNSPRPVFQLTAQQICFSTHSEHCYQKRKISSLTFTEINKQCRPSFLWNMTINSISLLHSRVQHWWHSKTSRQRLAPRATMDFGCTVFHIPVKQPCRHCAFYSGSPPALRRCRSHTTGCCQGRNRNSLQQSCQAGTRKLLHSKKKLSQREVSQGGGQTQSRACWELSTSLWP